MVHTSQSISVFRNQNKADCLDWKVKSILDIYDQDSVVESVIQAFGMVLFEDGLKPGTLAVDIWSAASVCTTPVVNLAPHVRSHANLGA